MMEIEKSGHSKLSKNKQRILVTGGAGYIGSILLRRLLQNDYNVLCIDLLRYGGHSLVDIWDNPGFEFKRLDITDHREINYIFRRYKIDGIVHLAAIVGDPACKLEPDLARKTNLDASIQLLETARQFRVPRFIFASTCSNYGKMKDPDGFVDEDSPLNPVSLYAELKVSFEKTILNLDDRMEGFYPTVLRFSTVYGMSPRMRFDLTINEFTKEVAMGRELVVYGENYWRPYCHVRDFSQAILAMQTESIFTRKFDDGLRKDDQWLYMLEDSLNLTAKLPAIAAFIYHLKFGDAQVPASNPNLDWSANFAAMMGVADPLYADLSRLYFIIHSDHESGNVSAHATHMVGSTLSDIYYATSAGMNGLAGPLHGRANQEALSWLLDVYNRYGRVPEPEELRQFAWDTLKSGQVIPGYGHAVLRKTDPRFTAQHEFGTQHFPNDPIFKLAAMVYDVAPKVLLEQGKAKDPWPNVDAISGALQQRFGVKDSDGAGVYGFYTVLFGVSRALGVSANAVWARALGQPLERPKSLTTKMLEDIAAKAKAD